MKSRRLLALPVLLAAVALGAIAIGARDRMPLRIYEGKGYSRLTFDRDGEVLDIRVAADGRYRVPMTLGRVPQACIDAAIAYEDRNYFRHRGVDPWALARAAVMRFYGSRSGGSTITMQLVRLRTGMSTKSPAGKLRQMWEALLLERSLDKRQILEAYFNFAPYGGGIEGLAAASAKIGRAHV